MILSDADIKKAIEKGTIKITPAPDYETQLGSCSIDLTLGNVYRVFNHSRTPFIDPYNPKTFENITTEVIIKNGEPFSLHPGEFILAQTAEYVEMPDDLAGALEGRSSIGRLGIMIHSTAATIDPGWRGNITLELANMGRIPVLLYPGMRICSLAFTRLTSPSQTPYYRKKSAKYVGQKTPLTSRIGEETSK